MPLLCTAFKLWSKGVGMLPGTAQNEVAILNALANPWTGPPTDVLVSFFLASRRLRQMKVPRGFREAVRIVHSRWHGLRDVCMRLHPFVFGCFSRHRSRIWEKDNFVPKTGGTQNFCFFVIFFSSSTEGRSEDITRTFLGLVTAPATA